MNLEQTTTFTKTTTYTIHSFTTEIVVYNIGVDALIKVNCFDDNGEKVIETEYKLYGEEFDAWGSDDNYVNEIVKKNMGKMLGIGVPVVEEESKVEETESVEEQKEAEPVVVMTAPDIELQ